MKNKLIQKLNKLFLIGVTLFSSVSTYMPTTVQAQTEKEEIVSISEGPFKNITHKITVDPISEDLCRRNLTGVIEFDWPEPNEMLDIVVVQDLSGSFNRSISTVGNAIKQIADGLDFGKDIDGKSPKDRMMFVTYQGTWDEGEIDYRVENGVKYNYYRRSGRDITDPRDNGPLYSNKQDVFAFVNKYYNQSFTYGGTPTLDGMVNAEKLYKKNTSAEEPFNKESYEINGKKRNRKTIYLLVTDGLANASKPENIAPSIRNEYGYEQDQHWTSAVQTPSITYYWLTNKKIDTQYGGELQGREGKYEAYNSQLLALGYQADNMRKRGGINNSSAEFATAFFSNDLSSTYINYDKMEPHVISGMKDIVSRDEYFITSSDVNILSDKLIRIFRSMDQTVFDQVKLSVDPGYKLLDDYKLEKIEGENTRVIKTNSTDEAPYDETEVSAGASIIDMRADSNGKVMTSGRYRMTYHITEDQLHAKANVPITLSMTFENKTFDIEVPAANAEVPGNTKTDCEITPIKDVTRLKGEEPNNGGYLELVSREEPFEFVTKVPFNSTVQDITQENYNKGLRIILADDVDPRLNILEVLVTTLDDGVNKDGTINSNLGIDATSGPTPLNQRVAYWKDDGTNSGYTSPSGNLVIDQSNNKVSYVMPERPGKIGEVDFPYGGLDGKSYYLVIKAKIKDSVTNEEINLMQQEVNGLKLGIPNTSTVTVGGYTVDSNIARVVPPVYKEPSIKKQIITSLGKGDSGVLLNSNETFKYQIELTDFGSYVNGKYLVDTSSIRDLTIKDQLEPVLEYSGNPKLTWKDSKDQEHSIDLTGNEPTVNTENLLSLVVTKTNINEDGSINENESVNPYLFSPIYHDGDFGDYRTTLDIVSMKLVFDVKVKDSSELTNYLDKVSQRTIIPNIADYTIKDSLEKEVSKDSNVARVTLPLPNISLRKIDDKDLSQLEGAKFVLKDLTPKGANPTVTAFTTKDLDTNFTNLNIGHTYELIEETPPSGYIGEKAKYRIKVLESGKLEIVKISNGNQSQLTEADDTDELSGNLLIIKNKKALSPPIEKRLNDLAEYTEKNPYQMKSSDEKLEYKLRVTLPESTDGYNELVIEDTIDEYLNIDRSSIRAYVEEDSTLVNGYPQFKNNGKILEFIINKDFSKYQGKTIVISFKANLDKTKGLDKLISARPSGILKNQATVTLNETEPQKSNVVASQFKVGNVQFTKNLKEGEALKPISDGESATFELYRVIGAMDTSGDSSEKDIYIGSYTNKDGKVIVNNLEKGSYYFIEISAPEGYVREKVPIPERGFNITGDEKETLDLGAVNNLKSLVPSITKKVDGKSEISIKLGQEFTYTINIQIPETITDSELIVTDLVPRALEYVNGGYPEVGTVDTNGVFTSNTALNEKLKRSDANNPNSLVFKLTEEDAVSQYAGQTIQIRFKMRVKPGTNLLTTADPDNPGENYLNADNQYRLLNTAHMTFGTEKSDSSAIINPSILTDVKVIKTEGEGKIPVPGAEFTLTALEGQTDLSGKTLVFNSQSLNDGSVTFNKVPNGKYRFEEVKGPTDSKYLKDDTQYVLNVNLDKRTGILNLDLTDKTVEYTARNTNGEIKIFNNENRNVKVRKEWIDNSNDQNTRTETVFTLKRRINGSEDSDFRSPSIKLYGTEDVETVEFKLDGNDKPLPRFSEVEYQEGNNTLRYEYEYYVEENYLPNYITNYSNQLDENDETIIVTNTLKNYSFEIQKLDGDNNEPLKGATFDLKHKNNSKIAYKVKSGDNGIIKFEGLVPGVYSLSELSTSDSQYVLDSTVVEVEILDDGGVRALTSGYKFEEIDINGTSHNVIRFSNYKRYTPSKTVTRDIAENEVAGKVSGEIQKDTIQIDSLDETFTYRVEFPVGAGKGFEKLTIADFADPALQIEADSIKIYDKETGDDLSANFKNESNIQERRAQYTVDKIDSPQEFENIVNKTIILELQAKVVYTAEKLKGESSRYPEMKIPNTGLVRINDYVPNDLLTNTVYVQPQFSSITFQKQIEKNDGTVANLPSVYNAAFNIERLTNGRYVKVGGDLVTDDKGQITIDNVDEGTYKLTETKAPYGFRRPGEPFMLKLVKEDGKLNVYKNDDSNTLWTTISEADRTPTIINKSPEQPKLNKTIVKKDAIPAIDSKHLQLETWREEFDYYIDISLPSDVSNYNAVNLVDSLPTGIDLVAGTRPFVTLGTLDDHGNFTPSTDDVSLALSDTQTRQGKISQDIKVTGINPKTISYISDWSILDRNITNNLANKTIRVKVTAKIADTVNTKSGLEFVNDENGLDVVRNQVTLTLNNEWTIDSYADFSPAKQYGLEFIKVGEKGEPLYDAQFNLMRYKEGNPDQGPEIPADIKSQSFSSSRTNGTFSIPEGLAPGKYYLIETYRPEGFIENGNQIPAGYSAGTGLYVIEILVDEKTDHMTAKLYNVDESGNVETLIGSFAGTSEDPVKITNRRLIFVPINKIWKDDDNSNALRPERLSFLLQRATVQGEPDILDPEKGVLVPASEEDIADKLDDEFNSMAKNNPDLHVTIPTSLLPNYFNWKGIYRYNDEGVEYNYYVLEDPVEGYTPSYTVNSEYPFYKGEAFSDAIDITNSLNSTKNFILKKVDDTAEKNPVTHAVFNISYENDNGDKIVRTLTTDDQNGQIDLSGLIPNRTYKLIEVTAPAGYQKNETVYEISVDNKGGFTVKADGTPLQLNGTNSGLTSQELTRTEPAPTDANPSAKKEVEYTGYFLEIVDKKAIAPKPVKTINNANSYALKSLNEVFTYKVEVPVTSVEGYASFNLEDTVNDLLEIVPNSATITADTKDISSFGTLKIESKNDDTRNDRISFVMNKNFEKIADRTVILEFKARVAQGKTLDDLNAFVQLPENTAGIPNDVTLKINEESNTSEKVYLTPSPTGKAPSLTKHVNGLENYKLRENDELFNYKIDVKIPENVMGYNSFVIKDTLAKLIQVEGGIKLTYTNSDGVIIPLKESSDYTLTNKTDRDPNTVNDGQIEVVFGEDFNYTNIAGTTLSMEFRAKLKSGVTEEQLEEYKEGILFREIKVPNYALVTLNGIEGKSEKATISPMSDPTIDKKVNGQDNIVLNGTQLGKTIKFTIDAKVPYNTSSYNTFTISDQLSEIFKIETATVTIDENQDTDGLVKVAQNEGLITATITGKENVAKYAGKTVKLTIAAILDQSQDLSKYIVDGKLPNTAKIIVDKALIAEDTATITPNTVQVSFKKTLDRETNWPTGIKAEFKLEKQVGANWTLIHVNGQDRFTVASFDSLSLGDLLPGTYRVTETKAPEGYISTEPKSFTISGEETEKVEVTLNNTKQPLSTKSVDKNFFANFSEEKIFRISTPIDSVENIKSIEIEDTVDPMFEIQKANVISTNGNYEGQPVVAGQNVKVSVTSTEDLVNLAKGNLILEIKVKLKDGFVYDELSEDYKKNGIPNTAEISINGETPISTNEVRVKVPTGTATLVKRDGENNPLPAGVSATFDLYKVIGAVDENTKIDEADIKIGTYVTAKDALGADRIIVQNLEPGQYYFKETIPPQGYVLDEANRVFKMEVDENGNVKQVAESNFSDKTDFIIINKKSENPTITKKIVDGQEELDHKDLETLNESIPYKVSVDVKDVQNWKEFTLTDRVDPLLTATNIKVTFDGKEYTLDEVRDADVFTYDQNTGLITFEYTQMDKVKLLVGKTIILTFDATIKNGITTEEIKAAYSDSKIPNNANLEVGNGRTSSNQVTVTPPGPAPTITKSVDNVELRRLGTKDQTFFYDIRVPIPVNTTGYETLVVTDELNTLLETADERIAVYVDDDLRADFNQYLTIDGNKVSLTLPSSFNYSKIAGKTMRLSINANIKSDATNNDLAKFINLSSKEIEIPNSASLTFNNEEPVSSNEVIVIPPGEQPTIAKSVETVANPKDITSGNLNLSTKNTPFTYRVNVKVPNNVNGIKSLQIVDTLETFLKVGNVSVLVDNTESNLTAYNNDQLVSVTIPADADGTYKTYAGKTISLVINAAIDPAISSDEIAHVYGNSMIPNEAVLLSNGTERISNKVTVTPPMESPTVVKTVNSKTDDILANMKDQFVYMIEFNVPVNVADIDQLVLTDNFDQAILPDTDAIKVKVNNQIEGNLRAKVVDNKLELIINKGFASSIFGSAFEAYAGKTISVEIPAVFAEDVDFTSYIERKVHNKAVLTINPDGERIIAESNDTTIRPPLGDVILEKLVDGKKLSGNQTAEFKLYKVDTNGDVLIKNGDVEVFSVNSTNNKIELENVLEPGDYYFVETKAPEGYVLDDIHHEFTIKKDQTIAISIIVNNTPSETAITVNKIWVDDNNAANTRPSTLTFQAIQTVENKPTGQVFDKVFRVNEEGEYVLEGLPAFNDQGMPFTYLVKEIPVTGYTTSDPRPVTDEDGSITGYKITNTLAETTSLPFEKRWVDGPDEKPNAVFKLNASIGGQTLTDIKDADGKPISDITLTNGTTKGVFKNLPRYNDKGSLITYTVSEVSVDGIEVIDNKVGNYTVSIENVGSAFIITNTYGSETKNLTVEKEWMGGSDQPAVQIQLFRKVDGGNQEFVGNPIVLNNANDWKDTWTSMPIYDRNGKLYTYSVKEINPPAGYQASYETLSDTNGKVTGFKITNTFSVESIDVKAIKHWVGGDTLERPTDVYFELYQSTDGSMISDAVNTAVKVTSTDAEFANPMALNNKSELIWSNLPAVTEENKVITYSVKEVKRDGSEWTNANYIVSYNGLEVTNTYQSEKETIYAQKVWSGGDYSSHTGVSFQLYRNGLAFGEAKVLDGTNKVNWEVDSRDGFGQEYTYSVEEASVPTGYTKSDTTGTGTQTDPFEITNTYTPGMTSHTVNNVCINGPAPKPDTEIELYRTIEGITEKVTEQMVPGINNPIALTEESTTSTYTWDGLPITTLDGKAITYSAKEVRVGGVLVENDVAGNYTVSYEKLSDVSNSTKITNTYQSPELSIRGSKTWENDSAASRPASIEVELLRNGQSLEPAVIEIVSADGTNNTWTYDFGNLPRTNIQGKDYEYSVRENNVPTNYEVSYSGYDIINTYVGSTSVDITKTWVDGSNAEGTRPTEITLKAIQNIKDTADDLIPTGKIFTEVFEIKGDTGSYTINDLPEFDKNGNKFIYTVDEVEVPGYEKSIEENIITNTLTNTKTLVFEKIWVGGDQANRPEATIKLLANGNELEPDSRIPISKIRLADLVADENGRLIGEFTDLPVFDSSGNAIEYSVTESLADNSGYTSKVEQIGDSYVITNTYESDKKTIFAKKTWEGGPTDKPSVEFTLFRNGEAVRASELNENQVNPIELSNGITTVQWNNLPENDPNGKPYDYAVAETKTAENYTMSFVGGKGSQDEPFEIKNTYVPGVTSHTVNKTWEGGNSLKYPSIELTLYRLVDGVEKIVDSNMVNGLINPVNLTSGINTYTWSGLPAEDSEGNKCVYIAKETKVGENTFTDTGIAGNYQKSQESTNGSVTSITNKYHSPEITIYAKKIWQGGDENNRPDIVFTLHRNGQAVETPQTLSQGTTIVSWSNQPKTDPYGQDYVYSIIETTPALNYKLEVVGGSGTESDPFEIKNTYEPGTVSHKVTKIWENGPAIKPPVEVVLYRYEDGQSIDDAEIVTDEMVAGIENPVDLAQTYVWTGLPAENQKNGKSYIYFAKETKINGQELVNNIAGDYQFVSNHFEKDSLNVHGTTVITNKYVSPKTEIFAKKIWDGGKEDSHTGAKFTLKRNGVVVDRTMIPTIENPKMPDVNGQVLWDGLDKTDANGFEYKYTVEETTVPANYISESIGGDGLSAETAYEIKNIYQPGMTSHSVTKTWEGMTDENNKPEIEVTLYRFKANQTEAEAVKVTQDMANIQNPVRIIDAYTWSGLPAQDSDGIDFVYIARETKINGISITDSNKVVGNYTWKFETHTARSESEGSSTAIINTYKPADGTVVFEVTKELTGRPLQAGEFTFGLFESDGTTPVTLGGTNVTATNTKAGRVIFPALELTEVGQKDYVIKEIIPEDKEAGMTYDDLAVKVTVDVTDNEGVLSAAVTYPSDTIFNNIYQASGDAVDIATQIKLEGKELADQAFDFGLYQADGITPVTDESGNPLIVKNDADGKVAFTDVPLTKVGSEVYVIKQIIPTSPEVGMTYDQKQITATVEVTDTDGKLEGKVTLSDSAGFINSYKPEGQVVIESKKTLEGRALVANEFNFELIDESGKVVERTSNDSEGKVIFPAIPLEEVGEKTYTIKEVKGTNSNITYDEKIITVTVTVRNEQGVLTPSVTYSDEGGFINTDKTPDAQPLDIQVTKHWNGKVPSEATEIEVNLLANGQLTNSKIKLSDDNSWTDSFKDLPKHDDEGQIIIYTVKEAGVDDQGKVVIDGTEYSVVVTGDYINGFHITNTGGSDEEEPSEALRSFEIGKIWAHMTNEEAKAYSANFTLYANGSPIETIVLQGNNSHIFENLPVLDDNDQVITYSAKEEPIQGFTTSVLGLEEGYLFVNIPNEKYGVVLQKVDKDTKEILPGAVFELWGRLAPKEEAADSENLDDESERAPIVDRTTTVQNRLLELQNEEIAIRDQIAYNDQLIQKVQEFEVYIDQTQSYISQMNAYAETVPLTEAEAIDLENAVQGLAQAQAEYDEIMSQLLPEPEVQKLQVRLGEIQSEIANLEIDQNSDDQVSDDSQSQLLESSEDEVLSRQAASSQADYQLIGTYTTDANGLISLGDMEEGDYYFKEIKAPEGYRADLETEYHFSLPNEVPSEATIVHVENTKIPQSEYMNISGTKHWVGDSIEDRPESIEIELIDIFTDNVVATTTASADGNWQFGFENILKKNENQVRYYYRLHELTPSGYVASYGADYQITNTRTTEHPNPPADTEYTEITGKKIWKDNDDRTKRPDYIYVQLINDDTHAVEASIKVTAETNWEFSFKNVISKDSTGKTYTYHVEELLLAEDQSRYKVTYKGNNIINTLIPDDTIETTTTVESSTTTEESVETTTTVEHSTATEEPVETTIIDKPTKPDKPSRPNKPNIPGHKPTPSTPGVRPNKPSVSTPSRPGGSKGSNKDLPTTGENYLWFIPILGILSLSSGYVLVSIKRREEK
ncbi:Cna B-type domain-containing protein [Facklamia miroungae]|uniref:Pilin isopeptide linkage domain-containing protein/fimbrial isopeptide formation D2 domain-containing protein n=1 Tax=Facklamia miroungae TaxID=120956 RepID=A0A1G7PTM6_9LACT|nr:Cna B-type domain-containing protein [Facklamia miroungae]NKZ28827.1 Cna B-type domain-containing protein [Facklamia miroungae]SDF89692.1 pilin isopeptide linkage domain-containing protein/fimbrial isopeptide formation D2 domain-containing protein [Facklamia miroungae]